MLRRTQVYLTEDQTREIKLLAKRENRHEAEVIRDLLNKGLSVSKRTIKQSTGDALLGLARLGKKLHVKGPSDLSSRTDGYLYGETIQK